jgi:hypothetical protein
VCLPIVLLKHDCLRVFFYATFQTTVATPPTWACCIWHDAFDLFPNISLIYCKEIVSSAH